MLSWTRKSALIQLQTSLGKSDGTRQLTPAWSAPGVELADLHLLPHLVLTVKGAGAPHQDIPWHQDAGYWAENLREVRGPD